MTFLNVPAAYLAYLRPQLPLGYSAGTRRPDPIPPRFVQVRQLTGAAVPPVRELVRLDVIVWDEIELDAMDRALAIRALTWSLAGTDTLGSMVYEVGEFTGPHQVDDPIGKRPRVMTTYELTVRADSIIHGQYSADEGGS